MLPSQSEKRLGKRSMRRKIHTKVESGTCNVCSAPCSSCMHLKLACMGSKCDGYSDESCRVTATSQNSVNEDDIFPFRNKACDSLQHTTSEASNLLSINLSHDSLSENAESKVNIKCNDIADASAESQMIPKLPCAETGAKGKLTAKPLGLLDQKSFSHEFPKVVEGHDDNISCISSAHDASTAVNLPNKNVDRKNLTCSSVLAGSLGLEGSRKSLIAPKPELFETSNDADAGSSTLKVQSCCPSTANGIHVEGDMKFDASKVSSQFYPKVEVEIKKDSGEQEDVKFKCSKEVEVDVKSNKSVELPDMMGHTFQSVSGDESDESEIVEHDVKVCDICGDAGREDLLAICSKCSDGAEHTYCMREMLQKVPEGDWLCEECKSAEETEKQKQGSDAEGKRMSKESTKCFPKRHAETMEVAAASKRQASEISSGSPKSSSPSRTGALPRINSFKGFDEGKVKPARQSSFSNHLSVDNSETAHPSSIGPRLQTPKSLLKSNSFNSFNSKPKVKTVDEVPQKQKNGSRDLDIKEGNSRMISKSMSFRSLNSGRSSASESKIKMISSKLTQAQDVKGLKQLKDRNPFETKSSPKLDRPVGSSGMTNLNSSSPKVNQKLTPRGEGVMSTFSGRSGYAGRCLSVNATSNASVEQKASQIKPKDEPSSSSSWTGERPSNNVDENLQDGLSHMRESSNQSEKTRESSASRSRFGVASGVKNVACHNCKETGHAVEFCSIVIPQTSCADASAGKIVREDINRGSKLKAAIEAAMLKKPGIFKKKRENDQSDGLSLSNVDATSEIASRVQSQDLFALSNKTGNIISEERRDEGQVDLGSCSSETGKQLNGNNVKQLNVHSTDAVISVKVGDSESVPSVGEVNHASTAKLLFPKMLTIPEHDYIWQGALEVCRGGKLFDLYGGIQAHLSTCASPKVLEVVNQFPNKITLDEVPRISTWPRQFHETGAKEDNIALYFFAKDLESYERSYKNLLDNMIKRDSALKASMNGVEFLIFPSTQLPKNSQRWNMLFFMWGLFWGRRLSCSDLVKKPVSPSSSVVALDINTPNEPYAVLTGDHDKVSSSLTDSDNQNDKLNSKSLSKNATNGALLCSENRCISPLQEEVVLLECIPDTESKPSSHAVRTNNGYNSNGDTAEHVDASCIGEDSSTIKVFQTSKQDGVGTVVDEDKMVDKMDIDRGEVKVKIKVARDLNEDLPSMDAEASTVIDAVEELDRWQSNSKKRPYLDVSEEVRQTSGSRALKLPCLNAKDTTVDVESISKKPKTVFDERHAFSNTIDVVSRDGFPSRICDLGSSSSVEGKSCEKPADEKVIPEDLGTTERYFFPVESRRIKDTQMGGNSMPWKGYSSSDDENQFCEGVPNLELALGAETKSPNKGFVPFFVEMVEKNNIENKIPDKVTDKEEDSVSASLSLSLSFPFPDKEQTVKPVSKTEQLLPERRRMNPSLLLFEGLSDK